MTRKTKKTSAAARWKARLEFATLQLTLLQNRFDTEVQANEEFLKKLRLAHADAIGRIATELDAARVPRLVDEAARVAYLRDALSVSVANANNLQRLVDAAHANSQVCNQKNQSAPRPPLHPNCRTEAEPVDQGAHWNRLEREIANATRSIIGSFAGRRTGGTS